MERIQNLIRELGLQPHPEGGYYKESYRSSGLIGKECLPTGMNGDRSFSTAIYFLLQEGDFSAFHRIRSDECWHFYDGGTLLIHEISPNAEYKCIRLGRDTRGGELFQYTVPANYWFASEPAPCSEFSLVGCTVAPGFDFADFELAKEQELSCLFPAHRDIIQQLCRL